MAGKKPPRVTPKVWKRGYVSKAQARHFAHTPSLARFRDGMAWYTPKKGGGALSKKISRLPEHVRRKGRR
jgi:hypothetical protein